MPISRSEYIKNRKALVEAANELLNYILTFLDKKMEALQESESTEPTKPTQAEKVLAIIYVNRFFISEYFKPLYLKTFNSNGVLNTNRLKELHLEPLAQRNALKYQDLQKILGNCDELLKFFQVDGKEFDELSQGIQGIFDDLKCDDGYSGKIKNYLKAESDCYFWVILNACAAVSFVSTMTAGAILLILFTSSASLTVPLLIALLVIPICTMMDTLGNIKPLSDSEIQDLLKSGPCDALNSTCVDLSVKKIEKNGHLLIEPITTSSLSFYSRRREVAQVARETAAHPQITNGCPYPK